ncbi:MAG: hypothetical protein FD150_52 [Rhodobacteraceae bacterium]|nr:MAG: hypothetical protein FD150_52 [Paracoccaceae bacterium]
MVGKFLLGMVSGGLVVAGGLIIGTAVAPLRPANNNAPVAETATETPIKAPEATVADAGAAVETEAEADTTPAEETVEAAPEPEAELALEAPAEAAAEDLPDNPPVVAGAEVGPTAPEPAAAALAEPAAPAPTEVAAPETASAPAKPAEAVADAAATAPEPAAPAPKEDTLLADAGPAAATPEAAPEPVAPAEEPAPVEVDPATQAEAPLPQTAAPEVAETTPDEPAAPAPEPVPDVAPAEPVPAEVTLPEPEPEVAPPVTEALPLPAAPESGADTMPGTQPDTMPGTREAATPGKTFTPAPGLVGEGEGLIIGRGAEPAPTDPATDPAADPNAAPADARPIALYAAAFENPAAKPPLAVVLIDRGQPDLDRAGLAALPFPVSFALDPLDPATPERAAVYRAAGREVVMLATGIATGAQASDVEVAFQSMEQGLPEAVAVMDLAEPAFQNNRGLASAVVPILKAQGRGLLTWDAGLNAADQVARREDLEAAVVFRDLGAAGADRVALRRLLDRAVFKAGQDGRVVVVGEADPDTVATLLEWSVEGKAATVALAPLTAVLKID